MRLPVRPDLPRPVRRALATAAVPGGRGGRSGSVAAPATAQVSVPGRRGPTGRRPADVPALLGAAVRDGEPGGLRALPVRARRRRPDVRADTRRPGRHDRTGPVTTGPVT